MIIHVTSIQNEDIIVNIGNIGAIIKQDNYYLVTSLGYNFMIDEETKTKIVKLIEITK